MKIFTYKIIAAELLSVSPVKKNVSKSDNIWDCEPVFRISKNDAGEWMQSITLTVRRKKEYKEVTLVTRTSFLLELGDDDVKPSTPNDFEFYVLISHMAHAHARVFFLVEMQGTPFEGGLLPQDTNEGMLRKVKWGLTLKDGEN